MHEICHDSIAIYNLSIHQLLGEQLAEFPTILDSFFTGVANIRLSVALLQGGRVGGGWEATKWRAKAMSSLKPAKWHPLVSFSPPHITQSS